MKLRSSTKNSRQLIQEDFAVAPLKVRERDKLKYHIGGTL